MGLGGTCQLIIAFSYCYEYWHVAGIWHFTVVGCMCTKYGLFVIAVKDLISLNKNPHSISKDRATEDKKDLYN